MGELEPIGYWLSEKIDKQAGYANEQDQKMLNLYAIATELVQALTAAEQEIAALEEENERLQYRVVEYAAMKQYLETVHKSYYPYDSRAWNTIDEEERVRHRDSVRDIVLENPVFGEKDALQGGDFEVVEE